MRQLPLIAAILTAGAFGLPAVGESEKPKKTKETKALPPKFGVKTPGVQIPFAQLKSEAEVPAEGVAGPLVFTDQVFASASAKNSLVRLDPKTNKPTEPIAGLDKPCAGLANAFGSLWVPNCGNQTLTRLDPKTGKVTATIQVAVANVTSAIAASSDSIWLLSDERSTVSRIDPDTNTVVAELRVEAGCTSLAFAESAVWLACPAINKVIRLDPRTNVAVNRIDVATKPIALTSGESAIWVLGQTDGKVSRLDPKTNKVTATIELGVPNAEGNIAFGEGSIWVSTPGFPLSRIRPGTEPATDQVLQQFTGDAGGLVQVGLKSVWLVESKTGRILRFDPKRIAATLAE